MDRSTVALANWLGILGKIPGEALINNLTPQDWGFIQNERRRLSATTMMTATEASRLAQEGAAQ